ncbi:hypothetical protein MNBD_GAMMA05-691 [hydrothermal vent metagenome]|uniref:Flagellar assembly protein FliH/Type III secretion system HrpE domain-containing protein n=1 Tax=hydrothermal vent metagenome TaxID=652676 RepID=A0A3B0W8C8_9ZZZZ
MSKIINCKERKDCQPWRAPVLNISEEDVFDYKLSDAEKNTHNTQQQKIRQQAYEKSYAKGYMEGLEKGQKEIREQTQYLQSLMATLAMPLPDLDEQLVNEMVQLCMLVVKQLVRRELKTSPGEVVAVIKEALNSLPDVTGDVTLELHPEDSELIRSSMLQPGNEAHWRIVEDPLLTRGGCRVKTNTSRIDATVENRLNSVIANIMGGEREQDQR